MTTRNESNRLTDEELNKIADRAAEDRRLAQLERLAREAAEQEIIEESKRRERDTLFQRESNNAQVLAGQQESEYLEKLNDSLGSADLPKTFKFIETFPPEIQGFLRYGEGLQLALQYDWSDNPQIQNETRGRIMDWYDKNLREASVPSVKKPFFMIESGDLSKLSDEEVKFVIDQHILKGKLLYESIDNLFKVNSRKFSDVASFFQVPREVFEEAKLFTSRLSFLEDIASETYRDIEKIRMRITNPKLNEYVQKSVDAYISYKSNLLIQAHDLRNKVNEHIEFLRSKR